MANDDFIESLIAMDGCLYIVKDIQTDEILCQGSARDCAGFLGCKANYVRVLATKQPEYSVKTKYSGYSVERFPDGEVKRGGAHRKDVVCCDCGVLMKNAAAHAKRCPACKRKHDLERKRQRMREIRNSMDRTPIVNEHKDGCEGCAYYFGDYEANKCCNYIFIERKRRPCPPGKDCTVKTKKRKKEREITSWNR